MTDPGDTISGTSVPRVVAGALRDRAPALGRLAGWSLVEALPALLAGYAVARAVDDGFLAGRPFTGLTWLAVLAGAVCVGAVGTRRAYACLGDVVEPFRDDLARLVVTGALRHATVPGGGPQTAAVARLTHQVEIVRDTFGGLVMVVRGFVFTAGAALLGLLALDPLVAALVAGPLLAGLAIFAALLPAMIARQREYVHADERLGEAGSSALSGHRDVVACGAQDLVAASVDRRIGAQADAERALARMTAIRGLSLAVGGWLPLVVLLLTAPWLVSRGLTAGVVLGALMYVSTGLQPALHALVQGIAGGGLRFAVTLGRILRASAPPVRPIEQSPAAGQPHATEPPKAARPPGATCWSAKNGREPTQDSREPAVRIRGLTFRYGAAANPVLDRFDLTLSDGEHLAVVGPSGAGKSTLAGLMAGLLRPEAGAVHLHGVPVSMAGSDPPSGGLGGLRVLIPQEAYVFSGHLADNLRYLAPKVSAEDLAAAIDRLGLRPLVRRLGGITAAVDPARLSAGERQLVAAVRAYLSPAELVILDEATCHLDPVAEARVESAFARRPGTLVVIAHRISSALRARRVLILDGGPPLLDHHDALLARSATYRDLVGHWQDRPVPRRNGPPDKPTVGAADAEVDRPDSDPIRAAARRTTPVRR